MQNKLLHFNIKNHVNQNTIRTKQKQNMQHKSCHKSVLTQNDPILPPARTSRFAPNLLLHFVSAKFFSLVFLFSYLFSHILVLVAWRTCSSSCHMTLRVILFSMVWNIVLCYAILFWSLWMSWHALERHQKLPYPQRDNPNQHYAVTTTRVHEIYSSCHKRPMHAICNAPQVNSD